jgi:hypothetical protein
LRIEALELPGSQHGTQDVFPSGFCPDSLQSKQYLTLHTVESAHPKASDIFAVAPTSTQLLSASGASSINVYDTTKPDFPVIQTLDKAHPLGIHHLVTAREEKARRAASAGFEGKVKIWSQSEDGVWSEDGEIVGGYALRFLRYRKPIVGVTGAGTDLRRRPEQAG